MVYHFHFSAVHIAGINNHIADAISHNNASFVYSIFPKASQVLVPSTVTQFILDLPDWGSPNWMERFARSLVVGWHRPQPVVTDQGSDVTLPSAIPIS